MRFGGGSAVVIYVVSMVYSKLLGACWCRRCGDDVVNGRVLVGDGDETWFQYGAGSGVIGLERMFRRCAALRVALATVRVDHSMRLHHHCPIFDKHGGCVWCPFVDELLPVL